MANKIFFAFLTQTFSLQQEYYFQYIDESSIIFGVASSIQPSSLVSKLTSASLDGLEDSFFANAKQAQIFRQFLPGTA